MRLSNWCQKDSKYSDTLPFYHTSSKICKSPFDRLLIYQKYFWMSGKQYRQSSRKRAYIIWLP